MKRTLVLTLLALLGFTAAHAQQQFATLQHGDSISVYYGYNAFVDANTAAVNSDIIMLSSGSFAGANITKSVTIRGAGMTYDTLTNTPPTIINGNYYIQTDSVQLEGISISLCPNNAPHNSVFFRCKIKTVNLQGAGYLNNSNFVNCIVDGSHIRNSNFVNCVHVNSGSNSNGNSNHYVNCVVNLEWNAAGFTAQNSILYSINTGGFNDMNCISCIGVNVNGHFFNTSTSLPYLCANRTFTNTFLSFTGATDIEYETFELTDSIASSFLGLDGTQVGIYGGQAPFNPRVLNYSTTVANQSRPDGKLEVTIQPINE